MITMPERKEEQPVAPPTFLTPDQVAARLNVSRSTVFSLYHLREIPGVRVGKQIRFDPVDIETFITEQKRKGE